MQTDSPRDSRTLTPLRALAVYALSFFLMLLLDADRFSSFLDRLEMPPLALAGECLEQVAKITGAESLAHAEAGILKQITPEGILGNVPLPQKEDPVLQALKDLQKQKETSQTAALPKEQPKDGIQDDPSVSAEAPAPATTGQEISPAVSVPSVPESPQRPPKVLLVGDSMMMEGFGPVLQRTLRKRPNLEVIREGKYSTGLSRPDYFDWPAHLKMLVERDDPDLIVICMGANDPQDIVDADKKRHHADSASWKEVYRSRAEKLLGIATARGSRVIWAGLPIMSKEPYSTRIRRLSNLQKEACEKFPQQALFVDTKAVLADSSGNYTTFVTNEKGRHVRLRYKDMVHVTEEGGRLLTESLLPAIDRQLALGRVQPQSAPEAVTAEKADQTAAIQQEKAAVKLSRQPRMEKGSLFSKARGKSVDYYAFLPECTNTEERLPVIYLLHGAHESGKVWQREAEKELLALASRYRLILIAPSCEPLGWYVDSPLVPSNRIETFLVRELLSHVERTFPVSDRRSLMGISMGGHGALSIGLRYPDMFASLSSMSGVLDITQHSRQWKLEELLGPLSGNRALWEAISPLQILQRCAPRKSPPMLVSTGKQDSLVLRENREVRDILRKRHFRYLYREAPGEHDWDYWTSELPQHMAFHADALFSTRGR